MTAKDIQNKITLNSLLRWGVVIVLLVGIPVFLIYLTIARYYHTVEQEELLQYKMQHQQMVNLARSSVDSERFFCNYFYNSLNGLVKEKWELVEDWLRDLKKNVNGQIDYLIWGPRGQVLYKSFEDEYTNADWSMVFKGLSPTAPTLLRKGYTSKVALKDLENVRKVIGKQFLESTLANIGKPKQFALGWPDSSKEKPVIAAYNLRHCSLIIFLEYALLEELAPLVLLKDEIDKKGKGLDMAVVNNKKEIKFINLESKKKVFEELLSSSDKLLENDLIEKPDKYYIVEYLSPKSTLITHKKKRFSHNNIRLRSALGAALYFLIMLPFLYYTFKTMLLKAPVAASIRLKLAFLIWFATGIPLIAMLIITQEHNHHKSQTLQVEAHKATADIIRGFDRRYQAFVKKQSMGIDVFYEDWRRKVREDGLSLKLNLESMHRLQKDFHVNRAFVISSSTNCIYVYDGHLRYTGDLEKPKIDNRRSRTKNRLSKATLDESILINLIGKIILSDLNKSDLGQHVVAKLELFVESILQRTFTEITNELLHNKNEIKIWGFANNLKLAYFNFLNIKEDSDFDYMAACFWKTDYFQNAFLKETILDANRNSEEIKITTYSLTDNTFYGNLNDSNKVLYDYISKTGDKLSEEIEIITYDDKDYLILSMAGEYLSGYKIIGLYPISRITKVIQLQKTDLAIYVFLSLLLSAGLSQLLAKSFLVPLANLTKGALAIENRDFDYRIKISGRDEFNEVGEIFNHIMVGLSEIETAKVVQESLYPPDNFQQNNFQVFGRSIPMSGIGGDYFDVFAISETKFVVLIGDVAGHGVGSALIMAMAKAGILCHEELQNSPSKIVNMLHQLILNSKTKKQRKIMTFQYIVIDSVTGEITFANAGGCSPILYKHSEDLTEELVYPGPVLGAFRRTVYEEHKLKLNLNDSLVLYTDGIVEARDLEGKVLGYEELQKIIKKSHHHDAEVYYNNIFNAYKGYIETGPDEDDITLIVVSFNKNSAKEPDEESSEELSNNANINVSNQALAETINKNKNGVEK